MGVDIIEIRVYTCDRCGLKEESTYYRNPEGWHVNRQLVFCPACRAAFAVFMSMDKKAEERGNK